VKIYFFGFSKIGTAMFLTLCLFFLFLNTRNFTKVTRGAESGAFYHPMFQQGDARLANQISCNQSHSQFVPPAKLSPTFHGMSNVQPEASYCGNGNGFCPNPMMLSNTSSSTIRMPDNSSNGSSINQALILPWTNSNFNMIPMQQNSNYDMLSMQQHSQQIADQNNFYQQMERQNRQEKQQLQHSQQCQLQQLQQKQLEEHQVLAKYHQTVGHVQEQQSQWQQQQHQVDSKTQVTWNLISGQQPNNFTNGTIQQSYNTPLSNTFNSNFMNPFSGQQQQPQQYQQQQESSEQGSSTQFRNGQQY
jgi:hypothetical protein